MNPDDLIEEINEMLDDEKYNFASTTLIGIRDTVTRTRVVTPRQLEAVMNIKASKKQNEETKAKWSRRYEGQ